MKKKTNDYPFMPESRMQKLTKEAMSYATHQTNVISKILNPHRYDDGGIYGQNDLISMWNDTAFNTDAWPEYKKPVLIARETNPVVDFYEPLLRKMRTQYFDHAFQKHGYKNLQELKQLPQFDISKSCEHTASFKSLKMNIEDDAKDVAMTYGMDIFTPCLPEYVIKLSVNHMLHIKSLDKNPENDLYQYEFSDYLIDKREVVCTTRMTLTAQYDRENQSIDWNIDSYIAYEDFLTQDIPDMGWSSQEVNFWNDIFGIEHTGEMIEINCPLGFDESDRLCIDKAKTGHMFLRNQAIVEYLQKSLRQLDLPNLDIIAQGPDVMDKLRNKKINMAYPKYLTLIALINIELIKEKRNFILPEDATAIKIGNLSVRTSTPLRLNIRV
jgi:hypothetical protein